MGYVGEGYILIVFNDSNVHELTRTTTRKNIAVNSAIIVCVF